MKKIRLFFLSLLSMIAWTGVLAQTDAEYDAALKVIQDVAYSRIKTNVDGTFYYVTADGYLTANFDEAQLFSLEKAANGQFKPYGYKINSGSTRFTNTGLNGEGVAVLNPGKFATTTGNRDVWEAQVLFLNENGKYAIRACNSEHATSSWGDAGRVFWTWTVEDVDAPTAMYSYTPAYVWELEFDVFKTRQIRAFNAMHNWPVTVQAAKGLVKDASQYISNAKDPAEGTYAGLLDYNYGTFFHSTWHGGEYDPGADHYLQAELTEPVDEIQFYFKKRQDNNNNRPTDIVISVSNDGENFEDVDELTQEENGLPTDASVIDYLSEPIDLGAKYKYVRFTILATNSGAKTGDHVFFTFSEFYIFPAIAEAAEAFEFLDSNSNTSATDLTEAQIDEIEALDAALKEVLATVTVTYELYEEDGTTKVNTKDVIQKAGSEIAIPAAFINETLYDYETVGTIGDQNCTIKVIRTLKEKFAYPFERLSNEKAYNIICDRGAMLTKDGTIASTSHSTLGNATPGKFAVLNYEDNYYLYSIDDEMFVQNNGHLAELPSNGEYDAIQMTKRSVPYYLFYFQIDENTKYGVNTNGTGNLFGIVINSWTTADPGNQYYIEEVGDFDPTEALAALEAQFNPTQFVTYYVEDEKGNTIFESEPEPAWPGRKIKTLPAIYQREFMVYEEVNEVIGDDEETDVVITGIWDGPFEIAEDFESANWQNISVRGSWYYTSDEYAEDGALLTVNANALGLVEDAYQWAFIGDPYHLMLVNKEQGEGVAFVHHDFASGTIPVFEAIEDVENEEDLYWNIMKSTSNIENSFLLNIYGTNSCVNQYGGAGGSLKLWNSTGNLGDVGSAFVIFDIPTNFAEFTGEIEKVMTDPAEGYFTLNTNTKKLWKDSYKEDCPYNIYSRLQNAIDDEDNWIWPETGYYRIQSKQYPGRYLSYVDFEGVPCVGAVEYDEEPTTVSTVVKLEEVGDHEYFISLAGGFVPDPQTSKKIEIGEEATVFEAVIVAPGVGAFTTENNSIHCADTQDYYCVGWTYNAGASQWTLTDAEGVIIDLYQADDEAEKSYATTYLPFSIQIADDAAAYTVTTKGDWAIPAIIGEGDEVPAFTPVLLISDSGEPSIWADIVDDMDLLVEDNVLWGTFVDQELSDVFVLNAVDGEAGFYALNGILSANKAFIPNAVGVKGFKLGDTTTAIKSLNAAENNTAIFNLAGQRVSKARKGVFIKEGKKVVK
ncbi:MAG: discoidin domain-containing protein [Bacteroidaceae bacterium]|nr:discoidin domain-containing protein [Bacteroidaceae bacterium]